MVVARSITPTGTQARSLNHPEDKANEAIKEYERLSGNRGGFESQWEEISRVMLPNLSGSFTSRGHQINQGQKKNLDLFDSTAAIALNRFAAILDSLLTPRNQTWHRLMTSNTDLNKNREVRLYFDEVNQRLFKYRYAPRANFASQNQQNYLSLGGFGTGCVFTDRLTGFKEKGTRYRNIHLGEIYFRENHQGIIDSAYRHFPLSAREAFKKWGDKVPDRIKSVLNTDPDRQFFFVHAVEPNRSRDVEKLDYTGMEFSSLYVCVEARQVVEEGGFNTFPYSISRYVQAPGETYGRGPAMDVLPAVKLLNEQKKTLLKQGHRAVDPILLVHDDGIIDSFSLKPGALNSGAVSAEGRALVQALPVGNVAIGKDLMDDERAVINDSFLVTIFQILTQNPQMTATEVLERTKEKGILLAPTLGRQQSEYLGPLVDREIDVLSQEGLLPPMPGILSEAAGEYRLEYDSPLSRTQRAEEAAGLMRSLEMTLQVVNVTQNPEPLDFYNWNEIIPDINNLNGTPHRWMNPQDVVNSIRQGRAQAAQEQTAIQSAPGAAALMNAQTKARGV